MDNAPQFNFPRLNEPAPAFSARTTHGDRSLEDYRGKWLILFSHLAWTRNIKEKFGVDITFPIIEDIKMDVARAYGMVHPGAADTQAVRATFFIDPNGILRAMVYYPMSNGRSIDEFVRLLQALQTSDTHGVATPENWCPGKDVIVSPPKTAEAADKRASEGYNTVDWYFSTRSL